MTHVLESATPGRVCSSTRLRLVASPTHPVYRVGQTRYGAINPQLRDSAADRNSWGRWDTAGGRTLYAGATALAAFAELLPYLREHLPKTPLRELFDDVDDSEADVPLAVAVRAQMPCPDMRDVVTAGWRDQRTLYELQPPAAGWFVDIYDADSISALNRAFAPAGRAAGDLTLSDLTGEQRMLTSRLAGWVREQTLDDGSRPVGIQYLSKHGSNLTAYAIWLRALDDGKPLAREVTREVGQYSISQDNPELQQAAEWNGLRVW